MAYKMSECVYIGTLEKQKVTLPNSKCCVNTRNQWIEKHSKVQQTIDYVYCLSIHAYHQHEYAKIDVNLLEALYKYMYIIRLL